MGQISETSYGFKMANDKYMSKLKQMRENKSSLATFSVDDDLPSLPLPELSDTLRRYLDSVKPHASVIEYLNTERIARQFESGIGQKLNYVLKQKALRERNWLENWWLDGIYLEGRYPLAPFSNTSGYLVENINFREQRPDLDPQLVSCAIEIVCAVSFFEDLRNEKYPVQTSRGAFFSMNQFGNLFNTCRIPQEEKDRLDVHFKTAKEGPCPTHALVIYKYRFFKLETYHNNQRLNATELYRQLEKIAKTKTFGPGIGALTADTRDHWAKNRRYLIELDPKNKKNLDLIERSMLVFVLDEEEATNLDEACIHGINGNCKNRFFDKAYQWIGFKDGKTSANMEHSPFDGMVSTSFATYLDSMKKKLGLTDLSKVDKYEVRNGLIEPEELEFVYDLHVENEIKRCNDFFLRNTSSANITVLCTKYCGYQKIKEYNVNPDTFSQMCMQLAYYQLHNKPAPTYESATTRAYYHGRTETVRSCTVEAMDWCKQMVNKDTTTRLNNSELLNLFRRACAKHDKLMDEARYNAGCDRHLFGLLRVAKNLNIEVPELYTEPMWTKSGGGGNFIISSSCVGLSVSGGSCYPMINDGYCLIYSFHKTHGIVYSIISYRTSQETDAVKMKMSLESAVKQVQALYESAPKI